MSTSGSNGTPSGSARDAVKSPALAHSNARKGSYNDEEIERGLAAVAICSGNTRRAASLLKQQGLPIPRSTLKSWAQDIHHDRYERIHAHLMPQIWDRIAERSEDFAELAADAEELLLRRVTRTAKDLRPDQAAGALRNVSVARAVNIEKASVIRGRPTQISVTADASEALKTLAKRFGGIVRVDPELVDGYATEEPRDGE